MTPTSDQLRIGHIYHMIIDIAVKINITLSNQEREELVSLLLREAERDKDEPEALLLQSAINYCRSIPND